MRNRDNKKIWNIHRIHMRYRYNKRFDNYIHRILMSYRDNKKTLMIHHTFMSYRDDKTED